MLSRMRKYRVREGSVMDWFRVGLLSAAFWTVVMLATVTTYPV